MGIVKEIRFNGFEDFYHAMGPSGKLHSELRGFVFRGQSSIKYKLIPSSLRYNKEEGNPFQIDNLSCMAKMTKDSCIQAVHTEFDQVLLEYSLLLNFYKIANYSGLHVPCINNFIFSDNKDFLLNKLKNKNFSWIHKEIVELAALAQHYGIPTRLLDWSFDKYIALYFAAQGACKHIYENKNEDDFYEVWAINYNIYSNIKTPLKFVVPSYSNNAYLCAQKGVLSYFEKNIKEIVNLGSDNLFSIKRDVRPLDELLETYNEKSTNNLLYRMIFPYKSARYTFYFLNKLGYHASKIFPGYKGVVLEMKEKKYIYD